ncbi:MAG: hypothetical protein ACKVZ0_09200 [Gemmatimonadales bacterium]
MPSDSTGAERQQPGIVPAWSGPLGGIAPAEWFTDRSTSSFWLRLYTILGIPRDEIVERVTAFIPEAATTFIGFEGKAQFAVASLHGLKVPFSHIRPGADEWGRSLVRLELVDKEIPDGAYLMLTVPYRVDGAAGDEEMVRASLDRIVCLLVLHAGLNLARDLVFDGEVDAGTSQVTVASDIVSVPQPEEGPQLHTDLGGHIAEVADRLKYASGEKRERLMLALDLMASAIRQPHGFFEYWTSLEVVCAGKAPAMRARLGQIYHVTAQEAGKQSRLDVIAGWRHSYVHQGRRPPLTASVERYLQFLFLDLLRHELELPTRQYAGAVRNAAGYDLSPLGLENRRHGQGDLAANS